MSLKGRTVLIPGASRSIGRAIARKFAHNGATLITPVFDWPESVDEMVEEFTLKNYDFHTIECDLRNVEGVREVAALIKRKTGRLDYLINNIERGGMPIVHGSYDHPHNKDQWDLEINTTLKAKWLLFHHCKELLEQAKDGAVINISSIAGITGRSGAGAVFFNDGYSAANRAVDSLTETWARETSPDIRVNGVVLGLIEGRHGENTRGWSALSENQKNDIHNEILLHRTGKPEEVAELIYFLAASATYMTGSIIRMDGGYTLGAAPVPPMPPGIL